jgi:hypothetical protein
MNTSKQPPHAGNGKRTMPSENERLLRAAGVTFDELDASPQDTADGPMHVAPIVSAPMPQLDKAALYGLAGEMVRTMAPHTEANPAALLGGLLVMAGAAIGRGAWMNASGCRHHSALFACTVGASSRARKTTAAQNNRSLFARAQILPPAASGLSTGEGLIHHIRDPRSELGEDGNARIVDQGVADKRLLVIENELARALAAMRREGNSLSAVLREAWDGSALRTLTKRDASCCAEPHVAILAAVTAEELRKRLDESELWNGFGNRILWLLVSRPHLLPEAGELPWEELEPLMRRLAAAIAFAQGAGELRRSQRAGERWCAIYAELAAANHGGTSGVLTDRAEAQVLRLSMLFALLDCSRIVEPTHLNAALAFWRFAETSVLSIFGGLSKDARNVAAILVEAAPGELSREQIKASASGHIYGERLDMALAELAKLGRATSRREDTGGRPRELWRTA